ncbi:nuclear transport factor 2 family protein [Sphingomonas yantingensis]|uniref:SnoaL-like domain-containing protein n=1 Tax=Sphingomonas yantingensis TaxID=1241761 RepID=A0A7W9AQB8_9SPHN|nr:nuclear transport factor 2 family protein [Sphingomonas yantingensis]MBB5698618.1 hypothetical protein [Sphingomonas yantingensis]
MDTSLEATVRELADRQQIEAALLRYCRGVDRRDKALMLSAYHPDAIDDHGVVVLEAEAFCDWAIEFHDTHNGVTHHAISNLTIDLDGDTAHSECYYTYMGTVPGGPTQLCFGRYVDRHERREGRWAIAARLCFNESVNEISPATLPEDYRRLLTSNGPQTLDRNDASYWRPLTIDPARRG